MSRKTFFIIILGLLLVMIAVGQRFIKRTIMPDVVFTVLSGQQINSTHLRGKVVVVHFWATSCATCIKEMPHLIRVYDELRLHAAEGAQFELMAVAMDSDPPMYVSHYAETRKLPFKVAMDTGGLIAKAFGDVRLTPTTFVVDKQGYVIKQYLGEPDWDKFQQLLKEQLAKSV